MNGRSSDERDASSAPFPEPGRPGVDFETTTGTGDVEDDSAGAVATGRPRGVVDSSGGPPGVPDAERIGRNPRRWRVLLPWLIGGAALAWLLVRVPVSEVASALDSGPGLWLFGFAAIQLLAAFLSDLWATWVSLLSIQIVKPLRELWFVRAATHLVGLINFTLGQGALGLYLARSGCSVPEASFATVYLVAVGLATLGLLGAAAASVGLGVAATWPTWLLATPAAGLAVGLLALAFGPDWIRRSVPPAWRARLRPLPLFLAIGARALNFLVFMVLYWLALRLWGFELSLWRGLPIVLALMLIAALPMTPYGTGTVQVGQIVLLSPYAVGATVTEREAFVLAFGLIHQVASIATQALIGVAGVISWQRRLPATAPGRERAARTR